jgi:protein phosphatase
LQAAHEEIRHFSDAHPELRGMGTTCTAAAIVRSTEGGAEQDALYFVHVGDTRLYLIREGQITRVTRDHSYVSRLVESGLISAEQAETHPQRNILTAALGTSPELIMDAPAHPQPLHPDDVLVICSDGLWGQMLDAEILHAVEDKSTEQAACELIALARERGGPDNITVEILRLR